MSIDAAWDITMRPFRRLELAVIDAVPDHDMAGVAWRSCEDTIVVESPEYRGDYIYQAVDRIVDK